MLPCKSIPKVFVVISCFGTTHELPAFQDCTLTHFGLAPEQRARARNDIWVLSAIADWRESSLEQFAGLKAKSMEKFSLRRKIIVGMQRIKWICKMLHLPHTQCIFISFIFSLDPIISVTFISSESDFFPDEWSCVWHLAARRRSTTQLIVGNWGLVQGILIAERPKSIESLGDQTGIQQCPCTKFEPSAQTHWPPADGVLETTRWRSSRVGIRKMVEQSRGQWCSNFG